MKAGVAAARALAGPLLATLLAACGAGGAPPAPDGSSPPLASIVRQCAPDLNSEFVTSLRIDNPACARLAETVWPAVERYPLLATQARPADVAPGGVNEIGV